jgi:hypothetical protein
MSFPFLIFSKPVRIDHSTHLRTYTHNDGILFSTESHDYVNTSAQDLTGPTYPSNMKMIDRLKESMSRATTSTYTTTYSTLSLSRVKSLLFNLTDYCDDFNLLYIVP